MVAVARFAFDVGVDAFCGEVGEHALVIHLHDVDLHVVEDARDAEELSRPVVEANTQPREATRAGEIAPLVEGFRRAVEEKNAASA